MISFLCTKKMQLVEVCRVSFLITGGARVRRMCDTVCRDFNASVYGAKTMSTWLSYSHHAWL